jgi:hypothetical protein
MELSNVRCLAVQRKASGEGNSWINRKVICLWRNIGAPSALWIVGTRQAVTQFCSSPPTQRNVYRNEVFRRLRKIWEKRLLASPCLSVCPSVLIEQLGSHWADFCEIWYMSVSLKSVEKIQVSLNSDKNNGTLHGNLCTFFMLSCSFLRRMRKISDKFLEKIKHTFYVQ